MEFPGKSEYTAVGNEDSVGWRYYSFYIYTHKIQHILTFIMFQKWGIVDRASEYRLMR